MSAPEDLGKELEVVLARGRPAPLRTVAPARERLEKAELVGDVGCFNLKEVEPGKWQVLNLLTDIAHVTYGTRAEVEQQAERQTASWRRKHKEHKERGSAWKVGHLPGDSNLTTKKSASSSGSESNDEEPRP